MKREIHSLASVRLSGEPPRNSSRHQSADQQGTPKNSPRFERPGPRPTQVRVFSYGILVLAGRTKAVRAKSRIAFSQGCSRQEPRRPAASGGLLKGKGEFQQRWFGIS